MPRETDQQPTGGPATGRPPADAQPGVPPAPDPRPTDRPAPDPAGPHRLDPAVAARLHRDPSGLVPAVVQDHTSREVLMVAWMDDEALYRTLTTGRATYWSRSRRAYWVKGETSGHAQYVRSVALDCDGDTLLLTVDQVGPACHTGARSCFFDLLPAVPGTPPGRAPSATTRGTDPEEASA